MSLSPNTTLAHYTIISKIGAGGMGEVYRARDTRLNRDVAIKVLPATVALDGERLTRFKREAQVLASLNHPNIAGIYGLEECDGFVALALELVPGPTLTDRIAAGPIPIDEALLIGRQIAEALEIAHERGIVHRDIKPANIKVTADGTVKVLDFGLAKIFTEESSSETDLSHSPTLVKGTQAGMILGTAAYMSPEQARGKPVDKRSDVWAFGCVMFEMLAGKQVFDGDSLTDILAAVVKEEPDWTSLPGSTPEPVQRLLHRCLAKDPKQRLRDIGDARLDICEVLNGDTYQANKQSERRIYEARYWRHVLPWAISVLAILIAMIALYFRKAPTESAFAGVKQFTLAQPPEGPLDLTFGGSVLLSPDGTHLVSSVRVGGKRQLFDRALSSAVAQPLDGTEAASDPFFSPDGKWLGFFANGMLKKVSVSGGAAEVVCKAVNPRGGVWTNDDFIVFAPDTDSPLHRVRTAGGPVESISSLNATDRERSHRWPDVLPGGKAILFSVAYEIGNPLDDASIAVLDLSTGKHKTLIKGGAFPRYAPTGHLIYARRGALVAVPFDVDRLEVTGAPATVLEDVMTTVVNGRAQFSFSSKGDFAYIQERSNDNAEVGQVLEWVDRRGGAEALISVRHEYSGPRLSPDGRTLFVEIADPAAAIWVYDIGRGTLSRLTQVGVSYGPIPSPDRRRIAYQATRDGVTGVMISNVDGSGEERLTSDKRFNFPTSWSPDGKQLLITAASETGNIEVRLIPLDGDRKQHALVQGPFNAGGARFSPDGHWIAYVSDESGRNEVYVRSYPEAGTRIPISSDGGTQPVWARNGRELFFRNVDQILAVTVGLSPSPVVGKPNILFTRTAIDDSSGPAYGMAADYDVSLDGQRFIMRKHSLNNSQIPAARIMLNWFDELKRLTSTRQSK